MKHYYIQTYTGYGYYQVLDTLDLVSEKVKMEDVMPLVTEHFIESEFIDIDISGNYLKDKDLDKARLDLFKESRNGKPFEFAIRDGYVKYSGYKLDYKFGDDEGSVRFIKGREKYYYVLFHNEIKGYLDLGMNFEGFRLSSVYTKYDRLYVCLSAGTRNYRSYDIEMWFSYYTNEVFCKVDRRHSEVDRYDLLNDMTLNNFYYKTISKLEGCLERNLDLPHHTRPTDLRYLVSESYDIEGTNTDLILEILILLNRCSKQNLYNKHFNHILWDMAEEYDKRIGLGGTLDSVTAKSIFLNKKGKKKL